ncbi:phosphoribosylformylglycinamidine cyclo-ligase [Helicobacter cholecystus]|uniref:Phosphoribosylformylglycinamidine cyclo-ligase n=1 Tax=Helicobacter cholecystus TaxID=45498 RepID=A0A3D8IY94_9HELI|nr:phosphoribosylformylglycinamidine cyclo-ligase [Helicobacter cholecystus]RDU69940.1 phosphoribosylformylglycinamidine cyclo-ligase [Helicobacter cholecystus]VEJ24895.1 phosphoribosylformylglycinamidine cyclo-ligase [Helicobacter cholecystus]
MKITYEESGVNINEGNAFVEEIKPYVRKTFSDHVIGGIGSFAGAYALPQGYKNPVILGATDGVGTKLRLAIDSGRLGSVGIDLVAMCVNDLICNFATPMFFLDYYACGRLEKSQAVEVIKGIATGCMQAECALIGGETAEMPSMYEGKDFDLAGFAVGVAEREAVERESRVIEGDYLIALPSSGLHSNGYSLARKVLFEEQKLNFESEISGKKLIDILLEPTRIYVKTFKNIASEVHALAHITGGGIVENLPRVLPQGLGAQIQKNVIKTPEIFKIIAKNVEEKECFRVFNMGVGMILACHKNKIDSVIAKSGGYVIGQVIKGKEIALL